MRLNVTVDNWQNFASNLAIKELRENLGVVVHNENSMYIYESNYKTIDSVVGFCIFMASASYVQTENASCSSKLTLKLLLELILLGVSRRPIIL